MNTTIRKTASIGKSAHLAIFTTQETGFDTSLFSKTELAFIRSEFKSKKRSVVINQYKRLVLLHWVDCKDKESYRNQEQIRRAGDLLTGTINKMKLERVTVISNEPAENTLSLLEGMALSNYQFLKYKSSPEKNSLQRIEVYVKAVTEKQISELSDVCESVCMARDLVNEPVITLNAPALANAFKAMGRKGGFKVKVFNKAQIKALKMGGLLAVNSGSIDPPTFTVMEYKPKKAVNKKPLVLVGKGIVYDTGGLSLKPTPNSMDYMKSDMSGSAVVAAALHAIARQKLPVHVIALVPATDNRPDGNAYTPGDVITMMSGLKVEVLNTDAEGRMVLADALHYAKRYKPQLVMEFSTLTGAAAVAIGHYGIVCMGDCDDQTRAGLHTSGRNVYERLAEFPFWDEYDELIKSDIADIKNIGGPGAGAITAGRFLKKFTDYPYMHFDIAGPSFIKTTDSYRGKNATGMGVRFIYDFIRKHIASKK